jgi:hypothetical protein
VTARSCPHRSRARARPARSPTHPQRPYQDLCAARRSRPASRQRETPCPPDSGIVQVLVYRSIRWRSAHATFHRPLSPLFDARRACCHDGDR